MVVVASIFFYMLWFWESRRVAACRIQPDIRFKSEIVNQRFGEDLAATVTLFSRSTFKLNAHAPIASLSAACNSPSACTRCPAASASNCPTKPSNRSTWATMAACSGRGGSGIGAN